MMELEDAIENALAKIKQFYGDTPKPMALLPVTAPDSVGCNAPIQIIDLMVVRSPKDWLLRVCLVRS